MALTLMVERDVIPGSQGPIKALLRELRSGAKRQPGFVSGQTVVDAFSPTIFMTISRWSSMAAWERWEEDPRAHSHHRANRCPAATKTESPELAGRRRCPCGRIVRGPLQEAK